MKLPVIARIPRWWRRRTLRTRLTVITVVPLAITLVLGTIAVATIFTSGRLHDLDRQTTQESAVLTSLVTTEQLPDPLPVPAGSPLFAQVIDSAGTVLAASSNASRILALTDTGKTPRDLGNSTDSSGSYAGVPLRLRVTATTVNGAKAYVVVAAPLSDVRRALDSLRLVLILVVPVLIAAGGSLAYVVIGLALRPVEELRSAAARLAAAPSDVALLPESSGDDEIARLARTFNGLITELRTSIGRQRDFVADAAHELRSPLASVRVQLDIAARHPGTVTAELVAELSAEVDRLIAIADDLVLLARLDAKQPLRREQLDLTALAGATGPPTPMRGDVAALTRLVRNLTDNARHHATTYEVRTAVDDAEVVLSVDDDGPGIPAVDRNRVFERWVRLDAGRSRSHGGSGLGLSLVREIAQAHGGSASVHDSRLGGTRVEVRLPVGG